MDKNTKARIKELKEQKKYDEIFAQFGRKVYIRNVPYKYKKEDLEKLFDEGKYEDIYNKYGKKKYNEFLRDAMFDEILETKGKTKAYIWYTGQLIKSLFRRIGIETVLTLTAGSITFAGITKENIEKNRIEYQDEIEAYNNKIEKYANEIKSMDLNDTQIFMKVMDDMWNSIEGYGKPEKDIRGFLELDLATEEGYGVCRNMASDVAKKLNEINPEYNARTMCVLIGEEGYYELADIEQKVIETNETVMNGEIKEESDNKHDENEEQNQNLETEQEKNYEKVTELEEEKKSEEHVEEHVEEQVEEYEEEKEPSELTKELIKLVGNHTVTFVDIPNEDLTIVLDPTNPGIGVYINGKIVMLNSDKENGLKFIAKEYVQAVFKDGGMEGITQGAHNYIKSFKKPKLTIDEIEEKYGVEAQNKALYEIREMKTDNKTLLENQKFEEDRKEFKEEYKINLASVDIQKSINSDIEEKLNSSTNNIEEEK